MPDEVKISPEPSNEPGKLKFKVELPGSEKTIQPKEKKEKETSAEPPAESQQSDALPQQLSSQAQQVEAARQLQTVRGQAKAEAEAEGQEEQQETAEQAEQSVMSPERLKNSSRQDLEQLKQQRAEELKKAQLKFTDHFKLEQRKKEIIQKFKKKAGRKADKYAKVAEEKKHQMLVDGVVTALQEVGPTILQLVAWICLFWADVCGLVTWVGDFAVMAVDLLLRGLSQYQRFKKAKDALLGQGKSNDSDESITTMAKDFAKQFLAKTVLPGGGGAILSAIPIVEEIPWEMIGVAVSGLLITGDLVKSYLQAKSAERKAREMA